MLIRQLLIMAARRAASDPRVRAKATELYHTRAKPVIERKAKGLRDLAAETDPRANPAHFAGRAFKRLLKDE